MATNSLVFRRTILSSMLALTACASSAVVFDANNLPKVRRMGVLTPGFPAQPRVNTEAPTNGAAFLLIGAVQAANRSSEFAGFVSQQGFDPEAGFSRTLLADLQGIGVQPTMLPADVRRTDFIKDYASLQNGSLDAVLDVVVTRYGYYAVVNSAPFRPDMLMRARLVDLQSGTVLMQDTITMVNIEPDDPKITLSSFQGYSDIAANPVQAVQAMVAAIDVAAGTICKRLA